MKELTYNVCTYISAHYYHPASTLCPQHSCVRVKIRNCQRCMLHGTNSHSSTNTIWKPYNSTCTQTRTLRTHMHINLSYAFHWIKDHHYYAYLYHTCEYCKCCNFALNLWEQIFPGVGGGPGGCWWHSSFHPLHLVLLGLLLQNVTRSCFLYCPQQYGQVSIRAEALCFCTKCTSTLLTL